LYSRARSGRTRGDGRAEFLPSGLVELDALLAGLAGHERFAVGRRAGQSALVTQYAFSRVEQGEAVACFLFEESRERFLNRRRGWAGSCGAT